MLEQTFRIEYKSGTVDHVVAGLSEYIGVEKHFGKPIGADTGITTMAYMAYLAARAAAVEANPKKPFASFDTWHTTVKALEVVSGDEVNPI